MSDGSETQGLVRDFLVESHENLDHADQDFVALERDPRDRETLARIFRTVHTIKGSCGFLGFSRLAALAHAGENLLGMLREGSLELSEAMTTTLLQMVDAVRETLATIESTGTEGQSAHAALIAALDHHTGAGQVATATTNAIPTAGGAAGADSLETARPRDRDAVEAFIASGHDLLERLDRAFATLQVDPGDVAALESLASAFGGARGGCELAGLPGLSAPLDRADEVVEGLREGTLPSEPQTRDALLDVAATLGDALAVLEATGGEPEQGYAPLVAGLERILARRSEPQERRAARPTASPVASEAALEKAANAGAESRSERAIRRASVVETNIRVDVYLLDSLMNQVGELVLARNQILRHTGGSRDPALASTSQRLDQITTELQESVMRTRLQPIDTVWNRLPRMVRDLALELDKRVRLEMEGQHTELDRTLNEAIRAPMTHLVRNAIDHGLETEEERLRAGKPAEGRLSLRAYHEGGQVNIEIVDDGRGIDVAQVERRALERGLITPEQAAAMSEREKLELIFLPGFSTASQVTNVSGRGVGMDVVRSSIDRINGLIDIQSEPGRGTQIKLKIPLTLAIIPALVASCGGQHYAIPQASLVAVVRLKRGQEGTGIETVHEAPVYRWRDRLLPIIYLRRELGLERDEDREDTNIVVLQAEDRPLGLVVDDVLDSEEIVVKPLGKQLGRIPIFAGATIMGDGKPALILDVLGLAQAADAVSSRGDAPALAATPTEESVSSEKQTVLLVRIGSERAAIPITDSVRLERFPRSAVELSGGRPIVQYHGSVLPLQAVGGAALPALDADAPADGSINVVVHSEGSRALGFVVDELLDIVEERYVVQEDVASGEGVIGTAVIQNQVARVLDLDRAAAARAGSGSA